MGLRKIALLGELLVSIGEALELCLAPAGTAGVASIARANLTTPVRVNADTAKSAPRDFGRRLKKAGSNSRI